MNSVECVKWGGGGTVYRAGINGEYAEKHNQVSGQHLSRATSGPP